LKSPTRPPRWIIALILLSAISVASCSTNADNVPSDLAASDSHTEAFLEEGRAISEKYGLSLTDVQLMGLADNTCVVSDSSASDWAGYLAGIRSGAPSEAIGSTAVEVAELAKRTLC
jgi:hypothetical protein